MGISLRAATTLQRDGDGFTVDLHPAFGIEGNANGGYLMAVLARAAMAATEQEHVHAMSLSYLRPGLAGPARVGVEVLRSGRTATYVRATLEQAGALALDAAIVLGAAPADGPGRPAPYPALPPEGECVRATPAAGAQGLLDVLAISYVPGLGPYDRAAGTREDPAVIRGWVRPLSGEDPDLLDVLLASDILPPSIFRLGYRSWSPTVQLTAHLHRPPAPGPLTAESACGELRDGWFDEETCVADSGGVLVARIRQLARAPRIRIELPRE